MTLTRRDFVKAAAAAAGGLIAYRPVGALAGGRLYAPARLAGSGLAATTASRTSRLFPGPVFLAHADLHNHTHFSDGTGDPSRAYASMRDAGLDIASLTDHSTVDWGAFSHVDHCQVFDEPEEGDRADCYNATFRGVNEQSWELTRQLADAANAPGQFTAIRGFEWSSPFLGHINVWGSQRWMDPLHTAGWDPSGAEDDLWPVGAPSGHLPLGGDEVRELIIEANRRSPFKGSGMLPFYTWMTLPPSFPVWGGGADGLASFNHPGREPGRFSYFHPAFTQFPSLRHQMVALEVLNRREDYLFKNWDRGRPSPIVECLNAGWRTGLTGVTDEHGIDWGEPEGKGRTGVWISELTRTGVAQALADRRVYATREAGLRLDAVANGVRMGRAIGHRSGPVTFTIDIDNGPAVVGMPIEIQVLRPDDLYPDVVFTHAATIPAETDPLITFTVPNLHIDDGDWVVLRIADPSKPNDAPGPDGHPCNNFALAYASPWWLEPGPGT